jgi:hypothetical protein
MDFSGDELAGVADLFGGLTRAELQTALSELAFRAGEEADPDAAAADIDAALESFALVAVEDGGETILAPGPTAFPTLPPHGPDLPHILDAPERRVDRDAVVERVRERVRAATEEAVAADDADRAERLRQVAYDAEAWADIDLSGVRERLADID